MINIINIAITPATYNHNASKAAVALAEKLQSHLTVWFIRPDPRSAIAFMGEGLTAETIQILCDAAEQDGLTAAKNTEAHLAEILKNHPNFSKDTYSFQHLIGAVHDHVGRKARLCDLAICAQPNASTPDNLDILNELLFKSGRLMVMVPEQANYSLDHIVIGWNGRSECARAISTARPLLQLAKKVSIVQIEDIDPARPNMEELKCYLEKNAITAQCHKIEKEGHTANTLHNFAQKIE